MHQTKRAVVRNYHIQKSTRQGEMKIIFEVSPDDSWRNLEAMSVFLVFVILPPANIQIAIFVIIWWQNGKKSINELLPINKSVSKVGLSVIPFRPSFRQNFRSRLKRRRKENGKLRKITYFVDECFQFYFFRVIKFKFCNIWFEVSLAQTFKFLGNEDSDISCILSIYTVNYCCVISDSYYFPAWIINPF